MSNFLPIFIVFGVCLYEFQFLSLVVMFILTTILAFSGQQRRWAGSRAIMPYYEIQREDHNGMNIIFLWLVCKCNFLRTLLNVVVVENVNIIGGLCCHIMCLTQDH